MSLRTSLAAGISTVANAVRGPQPVRRRSTIPSTQLHRVTASFERAYEGAKQSRVLANWIAKILTEDAELRRALPTLRGHARDLAQNNGHMRRFLAILVKNVVGHQGLRLQMDARAADGETPDKPANRLLELAFKRWSKKGVCTVCGRYSRRALETLVIKSVARDGEILIRKIRGKAARNKFNFALQVIEADQLDHDLNRDDLPAGGRIIMGVEYDRWQRPLAYHFLTRHPGDETGGRAARRVHERIPAADVLHIFMPDRVTQSRGVPWVHAVMARLKMLGSYEEGALIAARVGANKIGFYEADEIDPYEDDPDGESAVAEDDVDEAGNFKQTIEPGTFERMPKGYKFSGWDPTYPAGEYDPFTKSMLRGVAAGLDVSYPVFGSDYQGVTFSSLRQASLDDRDGWKGLQAWLIEELPERFFGDWLDMAVLSGEIDVSVRDLDRVHADTWRGRGWPWVDPTKDAQANEKQHDMGVKSLTDIADEQGRDFEETIVKIAAENALAKEHGVDLTKPAAPGAVAPKDDPEPDPDEDPDDNPDEDPAADPDDDKPQE